MNRGSGNIRLLTRAVQKGLPNHDREGVDKRTYATWR